MARMLQVHERLQKGRRANCRILAAELEVSSRTIQRDIDFMRDQLGLPIAYDDTAHGFFYTREVVQFPTVKISEGELVALSVARKALTQYQGTPYEKPLRDAFEKLTAGLRDQIQFDWNVGLEDSISFRTAGQGTGDLAVFEHVSHAVLHSHELEFAYHKIGGIEAEVRLVEPLHLACIEHQWYLFGADLGRHGDIRTFALTRINELKSTGRTFVRPSDFSLDAHLAGSFGVFSSGTAEWVELRFDAFSARLVQERMWHASQKLEVGRDGSLVLSIHVSVSPEIERWVLGWGEHVEVLKPLALRTIIAQTAARVATLYSPVASYPERYEAPKMRDQSANVTGLFSHL